LGEIWIFGGMLAAAMLPFWLLTRLVQAGHSGLALTIGSVIGASLVISLYASGGTFGVNPIVATAIAMLVFVPAFLGTCAGTVLGWLLRRRADREAQ
jgi:hypothetical protein